MASFTPVTTGNITNATDINQLINALNGTTNSQIIGHSTAGTAPIQAQIATVANSDMVQGIVPGDTAARIALYLRGVDGYGGVYGGTGTAITAHLYAQSSGWKIDESLTIASNLTVAATSTFNNVTVTGTLTGVVSGSVTSAVALAGGSVATGSHSFVFDNTAIGSETSGTVYFAGSNPGGGQTDLHLHNPTSGWLYFDFGSASTHFDNYGNFSGNANSASSILNGTINQSLVLTGGTTLWVDQQLAYGATPLITMPIGDSDTGINWYGDGHIALFANNVNMLDITSSYITTPYLSASQATINGTLGCQNLYSTSIIQCNDYRDHGNGYIGFSRLSDGAKLAEMKTNGDFVIGGNTYYTIGSSFYYTSGGSFDAFDIAEVFEADAPYSYGTILCPGDAGVLTLCTHVGCHCALPISQRGALCAGSPDPAHGRVPIAMQGRILVKTTDTAITARSHVTSDGMGGVMAASHGHHALGFALDTPHDGYVAIFLRQHLL